MSRKRDDLVRRGEAPVRPPELPQGIVTFLLTDVEGSTPLWETHTAAMSVALARHEELITEVVASHGAGSSSLVVRAIPPLCVRSGH